MTKKVEKLLKKMFQLAFGCAQHPKACRNIQQPIDEGKLNLASALKTLPQ